MEEIHEESLAVKFFRFLRIRSSVQRKEFHLTEDESSFFFMLTTKKAYNCPGIESQSSLWELEQMLGSYLAFRALPRCPLISLVDSGVIFTCVLMYLMFPDGKISVFVQWVLLFAHV